MCEIVEEEKINLKKKNLNYFCIEIEILKYWTFEYIKKYECLKNCLNCQPQQKKKWENKRNRKISNKYVVTLDFNFNFSFVWKCFFKHFYVSYYLIFTQSFVICIL